MYLELIIAILSFLGILLKEALSATAIAAREKREFKTTQDSFRKILSAASEKCLSTMAKDSEGAGNAWDAAGEGKGGTKQ